MDGLSHITLQSYSGKEYGFGGLAAADFASYPTPDSVPEKLINQAITSEAPMDVQVKLSLQGGHVWEFCCDEDDPIIFGLVSALPGADLGGNLPPDGLIQLETRTGERVFLGRSSLVALNVLPIVDELKFLSATRLASPLPKPIQDVSTPTPFAMASDTLPKEIHRALVAHALAQIGSISNGPQNEPSELNLGPLEEPISKELRAHLERGCISLGLPELFRRELQLELFAIGNGNAVSWEPEPEDTLLIIYHCYKQPKAFTGGGIRLFDRRSEEDTKGSATLFRDIEIEDNSALMFASNAVSAGLPVRCDAKALDDGLFVLLGRVSHGGAGE